MVTKRMVINLKTILKAKLYFFLRRSIWRYMLGAFIFAYVSPIESLGIARSFALYFFGLIAFVLLLLLISAKIQAKKIRYDADVIFYEDHITITHRNKDLVETKDWSWIKKIDDQKDALHLIVNKRTR
ncbi:hypothetical protein [Aquimarina algicola]|uniref:Uncharacterized protein n=1 Tax=Aquimarina algicola TaxID=2589995 RepID=A0A504IWW1_9FLAO|nr:hypothetical protein [Aquimarina algicola]TPN82876.1 hypothetical protein FHK87_20840 [Aquimarina algicola]